MYKVTEKVSIGKFFRKNLLTFYSVDDIMKMWKNIYTTAKERSLFPPAQVCTPGRTREREQENVMKTTLIFTESGETFLSITLKPGEVTQKELKNENTLCFAEITGNEKTGLAVKFAVPFFSQYNKDGFISRQSALNYEQDILDAHFGEYFAGDHEELLASDDDEGDLSSEPDADEPLLTDDIFGGLQYGFSDTGTRIA